MFKQLLLAATGLAVTACAAPRPDPIQTVYLSGPGAQQHYSYLSRDGRNRVVILQQPARTARYAWNSSAHADARRHAEEARRHAREAVRLARLHRPDPAEIARITREAQAIGEEARRMGELARLEGEAARLEGEKARRMGELARRQGEEARRKGETIRRRAEELRQQCERGQIPCERDGRVLRFRDGDQEIIVVG